MENLNIKVHLAVARAISIGVSVAGTQRYPLSGVLPLLSEETRLWLAGAVRLIEGALIVPGCMLEVDNAPTDDVVADAIKKLHQKALDQEEKAKVQRESEIQEALQLPLGAWIKIDKTSGPFITDRPNWTKVPEDPRIQARKAEAKQALLPDAFARWEADVAAEKAKAAALAEADKADEKKRQIDSEALRKWVAEQEELPINLRRAAADGFEIVKDLKAYLTAQVEAYIQEAVEAWDGRVHHGYGTKDTNRVPTETAYEIRDQLEAIKQKIAKVAIVPGTEIKVGPFLMVDIGEGRKYDWQTAVEVTVNAPRLGDLGAFVLVDQPEDEPEE